MSGEHHGSPWSVRDDGDSFAVIDEYGNHIATVPIAPVTILGTDADRMTDQAIASMMAASAGVAGALRNIQKAITTGDHDQNTLATISIMVEAAMRTICTPRMDQPTGVIITFPKAKKPTHPASHA